MLSDFFDSRELIAGEFYLLKKDAARALDKNPKTLERASKAGKIRAVVYQHRVLYSWSDLESFEAAEQSATIKPVIDTERQTATSAPARRDIGPADLENVLTVFAGLFQQINDKLDARPESELQRLTGKITLDIEELAAVSGFGKTALLRAIRAAESAGSLSRFAGAHGRAVWKCSELDAVLTAITPTTKALTAKTS